MQTNIIQKSFFHDLATAASDAALPLFRSEMSIANKDADKPDGRFDPVTVGDRNAELAMRALIEKSYPEHGILGEEEDDIRLDAEHVWVLDPIDGTRSFISGIPLWATLIGLKRSGVPVAGMMAQPFIGERFFGDRQKALYSGPHGQSTLKSRDCRTVSDALMCTTTPALFTPSERARYDRLERDVRLSRYGTDSYGYCLVAAGHIDAVVESGLHPYDIVALIPIIEGAGGVVTSWNGGPATDGGQIVASGNPYLHEQMLRYLEQDS